MGQSGFVFQVIIDIKYNYINYLNFIYIKGRIPIVSSLKNKS